MPLYEYTCRKCAKEFELLHTEGVPPVCPRCWSQDTERRLSSFAVGGNPGGKAATQSAATESIATESKPAAHSCSHCSSGKSH